MCVGCVVDAGSVARSRSTKLSLTSKKHKWACKWDPMTICIYPPGNDLLFLCTVSLKIPVRYSLVQTSCDSESRWPCYHHLVTLLAWLVSEIFDVAKMSPGLHQWSAALACRFGVCAPNNFLTHLLLDFYFSKENRIKIAVYTENRRISIQPSKKYFLVFIM